MYENCLKKFFKHPNVEVLGYLARAYFRQCYGSGPLSSGYGFAWGISGYGFFLNLSDLKSEVNLIISLLTF